MDILITPLSAFFMRLGIDPAREIFGNNLLDYTFALLLFIGLVVVFRFLQWLLLRKLAKLAQRTATDIDDTLIRVVHSLRPAFYYFLAFYIATQFLALDELARSVVTGVLIVWAVYQAVIAIQILIDYVFTKRFGAKEDAGVGTATHYLTMIARVILWSLAVLMVLSNFGVNVTSLIAGLGIGGVAIAFALQAILGDLFGSFAIYFDKPFQIGDFIIVGEHMGTVEKIGIKTTRLRALQGEEIVISNSELTSARIHNYKRMEKRRIVFSFGVLYETPVEKLKKIPESVRGVFHAVENADLDRVHFKKLGDFALEFEVVYFVLSGNYTEYMDIQQNVNLALMEAFERENITFAYPTQTVYLTK